MLKNVPNGASLKASKLDGWLRFAKVLRVQEHELVCFFYWYFFLSFPSLYEIAIEKAKCQSSETLNAS